MVTPNYPNELPGPKGFILEPSVQVLATDNEVGPKAYRRRSRVPGAFTPVVFRFLESAYATFVTWWRDELKYGHKWFWIELPSAGGITWHVARFVERYVSRLIGHRYWEVSAKLELRERQFAPSDKTVCYLETYPDGLNDLTLLSGPGNKTHYSVETTSYGPALNAGAVLQASTVEKEIGITIHVAKWSFYVWSGIRTSNLDDSATLSLGGAVSGTGVVSFSPVRESSYDGTRRAWFNALPTGLLYLTPALVPETWYFVEMLFADGTNQSSITVRDVTTDVVYTSAVFTQQSGGYDISHIIYHIDASAGLRSVETKYANVLICDHA